ncbi:MAG: FIST C-terminal domain-containing protein [Sulfurospirillum sp.]|nr:FIST C-terminal domain-containing protein [Sulfurospirillum sp.]
MKTYNFSCVADTIQKIIDFSLFKNEANVLVQVFCGEDVRAFKMICGVILHEIPQAICIGSTTDGEICEEQVSICKTTVSLSVFSQTHLKTSYKNEKDAFTCGFELAKDLVTQDTKLLILFSDGTQMNAEEFLRGVAAYDAKVMICGGMAGDNGNFLQTHISSQHTILSHGAVGVALDSDILQVASDYKFDWKAIGVWHEVQEVVGSRIYKIDGMTPVDFYEKYLGTNLSQIEFPLIFEKNGKPIARAVIAKHLDGSMSCGGNLHAGDQVKIGYGDAESLLKNPIEVLENLKSIKAQAFFIYSCMARRRYMPDLIKLQAEPFAKLAPTAGFFTYAEFYHQNGHNELLNQTLSVVALSEKMSTDVAINAPKIPLSVEEAAYAKTIQALTNLIQQSTRDYDAQSRKLEEQMHYINNLLNAHKQFLRHTVHEMNLPLSVIMGNIELHEMELGRSVYLENIEVGVKSIFSLYDDLSYLVKKDQISYFKRRIDLADYIRSRVAFFEQVAYKAQSSLEFTCKSPQAYIFFNETKLQRIIDNNLTNAIKYTHENKKISVTLEKLGEYFLFSVASHSRKIQHPQLVFEAFYREEKSKEGFGLGLNLVKRICTEEDIEITVNSDENRTIFTYKFREDDR